MLNGSFIEKEVLQRAAALERRLARERLAAGLVTLAHRVDPQHVASGSAGDYRLAT